MPIIKDKSFHGQFNSSDTNYIRVNILQGAGYNFISKCKYVAEQTIIDYFKL